MGRGRAEQCLKERTRDLTMVKLVGTGAESKDLKSRRPSRPAPTQPAPPRPAARASPGSRAGAGRAGAEVAREPATAAHLAAALPASSSRLSLSELSLCSRSSSRGGSPLPRVSFSPRAPSLG